MGYVEFDTFSADSLGSSSMNGMGAFMADITLKEGVVEMMEVWYFVILQFCAVCNWRVETRRLTGITAEDYKEFYLGAREARTLETYGGGLQGGLGPGKEDQHASVHVGGGGGGGVSG